MSTLQTLERGLRAIELVAEQPGRLSVAQLASAMGIHRTIAYRIVRTLQEQRYIGMDVSSGLRLGAAIPVLFDAFSLSLPPNIQGVLDDLSRQTSATAAFVVNEGGECVAMRVAARGADTLQVLYRLGARHPLGVGASGIALATHQPTSSNEPETVRKARANGYAYSEGVLQEGATGIFAPLARTQSAIGVIAMRRLDLDATLPILRRAMADLGYPS